VNGKSDDAALRANWLAKPRLRLPAPSLALFARDGDSLVLPGLTPVPSIQLGGSISDGHHHVVPPDLVISFSELNLAKDLTVEVDCDLEGTIELFDEKGVLPVSGTNDRSIPRHSRVDVLKADPR